MHPAWSVILLTTLIGAGQGLFLALYTGQVYAVANLLPMQESRAFFANGSALALAFLILGLVASFAHLGRPERAWRALSQWRSSWLSREVIILPATMLAIAAYGVTHYLGWTQPMLVISGSLPLDLSLVLGAVATVLVLLLFLCTAMIYASLRFLQEWHSPLTVINFLLLGTASGFTLAAGFSAWLHAPLVGFFAGWAALLTLVALVSRGASLIRNRRIRHKSSLQSAIGVRHAHIQQKSQGAMGGSFNTREFFHHKSLALIRHTRMTFLIAVFVVPSILLALSLQLASQPLLPWIAFTIQFLGLLAERWYFFAEARHPQNLYYQTIA